MRILHVLNEAGNVGNGIVNVAVDLACGQSARGHTVCVASSGGEFEDLLKEHGVRHYYLDLRRRPLALAAAIRGLNRVTADFSPDIVHAHMMTGAVLTWGLRRHRQYRLVTTVHNEYQRGSILMGLGDAVVGVSEAVGRQLVGRGLPRSRVRVIRNGTIGTPRRTPLALVRPSALQRPAVVTVGAVSPRKGSDLLVRAFAAVASRHPTAHLYFVGNRDWPDVEQLAARLSDRIHFLGFSPQPQEHLKGADIFALPSRREPLGLVLIEAREAGLPIVATRVDGIPEALDGGAAGLLTTPNDVLALSNALDGLLSSVPARAALARRASELLEEHSVDRMCSDYLRLYEDLSDKPGRLTPGSGPDVPQAGLLRRRI